jgi:prepilin-type N-terminal cleavage/methylation domain-containing protein
MRKSSRLGFSLVEVLIVIAVLAVLAMLLLSAVQKVREAASRSTDNNNFRQCAIAIHNYHGVYKRLPDAVGLGGIYKGPGDERSMWFHLLPYVEADNAYRNNVHNAVVSAYLHASDPYIGDVDGKLNFAGNIRLFGYKTLGQEVADNALNPATQGPSGSTLAGNLAAVMACGLSLADIKDGTSNVLMLTTRYADCGSPVQSTCYSASPIGTLLTGGGPVPSIGATTLAGKGGFFGAGSHDRPADRTSERATFQIAPTQAECRADDSVFGHSFSVGGLSVALADASVKSIDPSMSTTTFCRALCPSDGLSMANDWIDN